MRATDFLRLKSTSRTPVLGKAMHQAFEEAGACLPPAMAVIKLRLSARA